MKEIPNIENTKNNSQKYTKYILPTLPNKI